MNNPPPIPGRIVGQLVIRMAKLQFGKFDMDEAAHMFEHLRRGNCVVIWDSPVRWQWIKEWPIK